MAGWGPALALQVFSYPLSPGCLLRPAWCLQRSLNPHSQSEATEPSLRPKERADWLPVGRAGTGTRILFLPQPALLTTPTFSLGHASFPRASEPSSMLFIWAGSLSPLLEISYTCFSTLLSLDNPGPVSCLPPALYMLQPHYRPG